MYSIIHLLLYISLAGMYNAIHTFTFIHKPGRNIIPALSLKIKIRALEILQSYIGPTAVGPDITKEGNK